MRIRRFWLGLIGALLASAAAAESGTLIKPDQLKAEPFVDAATVAALAKDTQLDILSKSGGWLNVKTARGKGWVRLLSVRRGDPQRKSTTREAQGLLELASGRAGSGRIVSTTGIRGLSEEELKSADYAAAELARAESLAVSRADAERFAAEAKLQKRRIEYLPEPRK